MSLIVYRPRSIPADVKICEDTDEFFDTNCCIPDTVEAETILRMNEAVKRVDSTRFDDITPQGLSPRDKKYLLPETKVGLCILQYPDVCFDLIDCWSEVIDTILLLKKGTVVYWRRWSRLTPDMECDILFNNAYHCTTIGELNELVDKVL